MGRMDFDPEVDAACGAQPGDSMRHGPGQVHLAALLRNVAARLSRHEFSPGIVTQRKLFVKDVALVLGKLWESSRYDKRWDEIGHVSLGVLTSSTSRKPRLISPHSKTDELAEARNQTWEGLKGPRQLLIGLAAAKHKPPPKRQRLAVRREARNNMACFTATGQGFEHMVAYNYFLDARTQTHLRDMFHAPSVIIIIINWDTIRDVYLSTREMRRLASSQTHG